MQIVAAAAAAGGSLTFAVFTKKSETHNFLARVKFSAVIAAALDMKVLFRTVLIFAVFSFLLPLQKSKTRILVPLIRPGKAVFFFPFLISSFY